MRTYKVFAPAGDRAAIEALGKPVMRYEAFVVVEVGDAAARTLLRRYACEDLTEQYRLPLEGGEIDPLSPAWAKAVRSEAPVDDAPHHYLVQFVGPVKDTWIAALRRAGAVLRQPTSGFGYVVKGDGAAVRRFRALPFVRWCGHLPHADRVAPELKGEVKGAPLPRRRVQADTLVLEVFDAADIDRIAEGARGLGFSVVSRNKRARLLTLRAPSAEMMAKVMRSLSALHGVQEIRRRTIVRTCNDVAGRIVRRDVVARPAPGMGLTGEGEVVAICDTGLDAGDPARIHPDFAGRVITIKSYRVDRAWRDQVFNVGRNDGAADLDAGHGTHVAGTLLGDGRASAGGPDHLVGIAPRAKLVFQAVEQRMKWRPEVDEETKASAFEMAGMPDDVGPLLEFAYARGARVHNDSWAGGDAGAYDSSCRQIDRFVWKHKDMCIVVAAGNDGSDTGGLDKNKHRVTPGNGRINPTSVTPPGTAKNCITVGASENDRPRFRRTYGGIWPDDYPRAPWRDDRLADDADSVAAFSARGPTLDGRAKPDLVAPGTMVLSTRSSQLASNNFAEAIYPPNKRRYFHMSGTSMATPVVSGCALLVREFLRKRRGIASATAALVKAVLVAGCVRLPEGGKALVDSTQGFGRVDLERSLARLLLAHEGAGLRTGAAARVDIDVPSGGRTLRVAMAYTDYPGKTLVNNLNLFVAGPRGERHLGNRPEPGGTGLVLDARNNVEVVEVRTAAPGRWVLQVVASNVSRGPQDFALAAVLV